MIDHRRALTLAATAVDFQLDAADRGILDAHVRDCAACRLELAAYHRDAARLVALPPIVPPARVRGAIGKAHRPTRFVLLAAAALLLTASGGLALVGSALRDARTPDVPPAVRPVPTVAVSQSPTIAGGWAPVPDQASVSGVQFQHVIWTGTRFVATGQALGAGGTFLDSSDGLTWHRQPPSSPGALPASLAAGPGGVVAVGTIDGRPASWFSTDGLTWTARADAFPVPAIGTDTFAVTAAVATDAGWLAVGREDPYCNMNCGLTPVRAISWTSSDGLHWTRVPDQTSLGNAAMTGVARLDSGFVAVGLAANRAVVWTSTDGSTWTRVPDAPLFHPRPGMDPSFWAQMTGVAVGHGVVVAVGMDGAPGGGGGSVLAWWSTDGRTWAQATGERFLSGQVFGVTATPEGFLATGPSGEPSCLGGIWASSDGRTWQCTASAPAFAGFGPYAAAASTSVEVAVGLQAMSDPPPAGLPGAVWRRTLPLPGPTPVPTQIPAADCVNPPPDIAALSVVADPVACYGNAPLTLDAYPVAVSVDCPVSGEPAWLWCPSGELELVGETRKVGAPFLLVAVDPASGASLSGHFNTNVRITGHYDDPAAQTCRETGRVAALGTPEPAAVTVEGCRRRFVVTQVVPLQP